MRRWWVGVGGFHSARPVSDYCENRKKVAEILLRGQHLFFSSPFWTVRGRVWNWKTAGGGKQSNSPENIYHLQIPWWGGGTRAADGDPTTQLPADCRSRWWVHHFTETDNNNNHRNKSRLLLNWTVVLSHSKSLCRVDRSPLHRCWFGWETFFLSMSTFSVSNWFIDFFFSMGKWAAVHCIRSPSLALSLSLFVKIF